MRFQEAAPIGSYASEAETQHSGRMSANHAIQTFRRRSEFDPLRTLAKLRISEAMNFNELDERLQAEGYGPHISERGPSSLSLGDYRIEEVGDNWRVCSTDRGKVTQEDLVTSDESAACTFFHENVSCMMWHFKTFLDRPSADALERTLSDAGLQVWRNDIPQFNGPNDPRYRVFVSGSDLHEANRRIGAFAGREPS